MLIVYKTKCAAGVQGTGGWCDCSKAKGWIERNWREPWCSEVKCYTGQSFGDCRGKDNGHSLGDGTWCWDERRDTECPVTPGKTNFKLNFEDEILW